ncbi:MAG TPA: DUF805 domain-containing protein [Candidatus Limnocylindrales bacterium]|nr:DUF805 domain-containing protein [Candidatus Limnocylindrales bacterium]
MTFVEAAKAALVNYAEFSGRSSRMEFWSFQLAVAVTLGGLIGAAFLMIGIASLLSEMTALMTAFLIVSVLFLAAYLMAFILVIVPWLAVCTRRLHDTNRSASWLLIALFVPFGQLVVLFFLATESDPGPNDYGPNPYAPTF